MSTDYGLKCLICGETLEMVASGSIAYGDKLWRDEASLDRLRDFLFAHLGHSLIFADHQILDDEEGA